jgi:5-methylcytosine-specific restriction endonuclease McrA
MTTKNKREFKAVLKRDSFTCQLCGKPYHHIHHIVHKSHQGANIRQNMVCLCRDCHETVHQDEKKWRDELIELMRGHYGMIEIDDLKRKNRWVE